MNRVTELTKLPLLLRTLNLAGRGAQAIGLQPVDLTFDGLLRKASANTGLSDFGEDDFRDPLKRLLAGLEEEAQLSLLGRVIARCLAKSWAADYPDEAMQILTRLAVEKARKRKSGMRYPLRLFWSRWEPTT